jgi:hypothetical protein
MIPLVGTIVAAVDLATDVSRLKDDNLPDYASKNILQRVSNKFNETLDQVENSVNLFRNAVQEKFQNYQQTIVEKDEIIEAKSETIRSLNAELDQLKDVFLDETKVANESLEIKRLKYQLKASEKLNQALQRKIRDLNQNHQQKVLTEEKANASSVSSEIDNLHKIIEQLNNRNLQLQERLNEKKEKANDDDLYTFTTITTWIAERVARSLGLKDVATFAKNFAIIADNVWRSGIILLYVYTLFNATDNYLYWLKNAWKSKLSKAYALSIFTVMLFCMIKLLGF